MKNKQRDFKYKFLTLNELIINLDRLSRFKLPEESYNRVFLSILTNCLIYPQFSKKELENINTETLTEYVKTIWNKSVNYHFGDKDDNKEANNALRMLAHISFKNIDKDTENLIKTDLKISPILEHINIESSPQNLKFLAYSNKKFNSKNKITKEKAEKLRKQYKLKFPVSKLFIVEGITEEILLPVFANELGYNFDKEGIFILGAGGKSKSPNLYLKLKDKLNIPITLLFDNDAIEVCKILQKKLLQKDKMILINKGEFEDILPLNLIKRALNSEYETITPLVKDELRIYNRMCDNIQHFYQTRKIGEFKKSKFSRIIAENIKYSTDISNEINDIIKEIIK